MRFRAWVLVLLQGAAAVPSSIGRAAGVFSRAWVLVPLQGTAAVCASELGRWCCCVRLGAWVFVPLLCELGAWALFCCCVRSGAWVLVLCRCHVPLKAWALEPLQGAATLPQQCALANRPSRAKLFEGTVTSPNNFGEVICLRKAGRGGRQPCLYNIYIYSYLIGRTRRRMLMDVAD